MFNLVAKKIKRHIISSIVLLFAVLLLCGCEKNPNSKVVFTTGLSKNEVFRIGREVCTLDEIMVYLVNTQNQYEQVYGDEIWSAALDGVTLEDNVKETVLAKIAQIKSMYLLAIEKGIVLDESEKDKVKTAAGEYYSSLNEQELKCMGVSLSTIEKMYEEYALADKVYDFIIKDVNPEISDDEARTITVAHILIRTRRIDDDGNIVEYSDEKKAEALENMKNIQEMALSGEYEFESLAADYSEDENIIYSFGKGEMDKVFENAAFELQTDEISEIIKSDIGYHLIKCLNTFNREETDQNKIEIVEQRRQEVFGEEYDTFVEGQIREINEKLWEKVALVSNPEVNTVSFFEVYARYFE